MPDRIYFLKPIFLSKDGCILVDFSNFHDRLVDKVTFKRYPIKTDITTDDQLQKEMKIMESFINDNNILFDKTLYLKTSEILGGEHGIKEVNILVFFYANHLKQSKKEKGNIKWIPIYEFLGDENIYWADKENVNSFINGRLTSDIKV